MKKKIKPWINKTYSNGIGNSGIKVMIIGASHYCSLDENNSNYDVVKNYPYRFEETIFELLEILMQMRYAFI